MLSAVLHGMDCIFRTVFYVMDRCMRVEITKKAETLFSHLLKLDDELDHIAFR